MIRVEIKPELLSWARERAGFDPGALAHRFPKLAAWEQGTLRRTLKQIEKFATATHTPIGFLFLQQPPVERVLAMKEKRAAAEDDYEKRRLDQFCADLDREIDHLVYKLYKLTDDEIAIVEGQSK